MTGGPDGVKTPALLAQRQRGEVEVAALGSEQKRLLREGDSVQIGADQVAFMSILTAVLRPQFVVEVGTFTGTSSLAVAGAPPEVLARFGYRAD